MLLRFVVGGGYYNEVYIFFKSFTYIFKIRFLILLMVNFGRLFRKSTIPWTNRMDWKQAFCQWTVGVLQMSCTPCQLLVRLFQFHSVNPCMFFLMVSSSSWSKIMSFTQISKNRWLFLLSISGTFFTNF